MSTHLIKPAGITGINTGHTLAANIKLFWELGQTNTDLVDGAALTTTALNANTAEMGDVRHFIQASDKVVQTVPINSDESVFVIKQHLGTNLNGGNSDLSYVRMLSGNSFVIHESGYSVNQQGKTVRSSFQGSGTLRYTPYSSDILPFGVPEIVHGSSELTNSTAPLYINSVSVPVSAVIGTMPTLTTFSTEPIQASVYDNIGSDADAYISAIIVFDRVLTETEILAVEDDPWALVATASAGPNTPINPSITSLLATSAHLNWEQG